MTTTVPAVVEHKPLAPLDLQQTKQSMQTYQEGLHALLDDTDQQTFVDKKTGEKRSFVKRSGWRKIATWFELNLETRHIEIDRDSRDRPQRARVIARAIAPNGRYAEGDGGCSLEEPRQFAKPEHDLVATASTRAINRAISNLVGMGAVSAEEIDGTPETTAAMPFGPLATPDDAHEAAAAVQKVLPSLDGHQFVQLLIRTFDQPLLPEVAARTLKGLAWFAQQPEATGNQDASSTNPKE